jgi:Skp family chaperone for outer membrane proteins
LSPEAQRPIEFTTSLFYIPKYYQQMKFSRLIVVGLIFAAFLAVSASAQTTAPGTKVGLIDSRFFLDEKLGIKRYIDAVTSINNEFKATAAELDGINTRLISLDTEIKTFKDQVQKGVKINEALAASKLEEFDKLSREYKFKKEGAEANYNRRQQTVLNPIRLDIGKAIAEFAKKNGYVIIFDISKDQTEMILVWDPAAIITKEFIAFYNARPVPAVVPK